MTLGGGVSGEDLLSLATDQTQGELGVNHAYTVDSTLHMIDVELGWRWTFLKTWMIRVGLGFAATVYADTAVTPDFAPIPIVANAVYKFAHAAEAYLDQVYTSYVFTPTLSIGLGFRFF